MMLAATHFAIGLAAGLLLLTPLTDRWDNSTIAIMSGFWAMGPDVGVFITQLSFLQTSWWANMFWFHPLLDAFETTCPNGETLAAMTFLLFTVVLLERKGYYTE